MPDEEKPAAVEEVLIPPEEKAKAEAKAEAKAAGEAASPEDAEEKADEKKQPEPPPSKLVEWSLAVALMAFFAFLSWMFISFIRP